MQGYGGGNAAEQYLVQRIQGASTEQLAAMLLEGAERFLNSALSAMANRDIPAKARFINRVSAILEELAIWLDFEGGGELATNLARIYDWWLHELFEGSQANDRPRLERIQKQMGEIRAAWQEFDLKRQAPGKPAASLDGMVG